jgi:uncharacterized protein
MVGMIARDLVAPIRRDLDERIVLVSGPRQSGKTTLSRSLGLEHDYFNYDAAPDRLRLMERSWDRSKPLVIFDELHKMRAWKAWLKGIYDTEGVRPRLLVTGSARLDTYRRAGDSLAGRYFRHRLHPLDLAEVRGQLSPEDALERMLRLGGFPEPFLGGEERFYKRWRQTHTDIIIRQDLIELETVKDIRGIETLVELLRHRVGSPTSFASLARDLERDAKTVKRWLELLESLYVVFRVSPWHRNVARSLLKEPKYYFYDTGAVLSGDGGRFENLVACALLKSLHRIEDVDGDRTTLRYLRTKDGHEVDFFVAIEGRPPVLIETKWADAEPTRAFAYFERAFRGTRRLQLVRKLGGSDRTHPNGDEVRSAAHWLASLGPSSFHGGKPADR